MPTLVLIHGNSLNKSVFIRITRKKIKQIDDIIHIELPGHGTQQKFLKYTLEEVSIFLCEKINSIKDEKVILAHSLSGHAILQNLQLLKNVKGIVCIGTPPLGNLSSMSKAFTDIGISLMQPTWSKETLISVSKELSEKAFLDIQTMLLSTDQKFREDFGITENLEPFKNELLQIENSMIPILLIFGTNDGFVNKTYIKSISKTIKRKNAIIKHVVGFDHLPFFNSPERFIDTLNYSLTNLLSE